MLRILADLAVFLMVIFLPVLWVIFTDRFRHLPSPGQYASLFAVAAVAGTLLFLPALSVVFATALLALGTARLTGHYALAGVSYTRGLTPSRLFPGDEADLVLRLDNRKILPLAWVTVTDPVHYGVVRSTNNLAELLDFSGGLETLDNLGFALVNRAAVGPYQSLKRTYRVKALQRGVYAFGPARIVSGDIFGIFQHEMSTEERIEAIVYPRVYRPEEIGLPFREPMGDLVTRKTLFEDPTLIAGSRQYRSGDPLHRMHWKATARTGELQVRQTDASTTAQLMLVLNLNTFQHVWQGVDLDRMEAVIDVGASLAVWALDRDFMVGLRSNGIIPGTENTPRISPSASLRQASFLLEQLARVSFSGRYSAEFVLDDEARRLPAGASMVFVTTVLSSELIAILTSRRIAGRVSVVYCGRHAAPVVRGIPIYLASPPGSGVQHAAS